MATGVGGVCRAGVWARNPGRAKWKVVGGAVVELV